MSFTKKRLIQERNILLEKQYILEQAPPPPSGNIPTTPPTSGVTTTPTTTTTTTLKKISDSDLKILPECSEGEFKNKKSGYTTNEFIVFVTTTDNKPLCKKKK